MDYYYSLLESYQQLKRRTFKLSLREQEEEQDLNAVANDVATALGDIRSKEVGYEESGLGNGKNLNVEVLDRAGVKISGGNLGWGIQLSGSQIGNLKNSWTKENSKGNRVVKAWASSGEAPKPKGGGDGGRIQQKKEVEENPLEGEAQALQDSLFGTEEKEGLFKRDEDGVVEPSVYFPDYKDAERQSRLSKAITAVQKKETGEEQGLGIRGAAAEDTSITDKLLASPNLPPEQAAKSLKTVQQGVAVITAIHRGDTIPPDDLRSVAKNTEITPEGVLFNGVYIQYRSKSNAKNDMYRNMADQINKQIDKHNKECPPTDTEAGKDCHVNKITAPAATTGSDMAVRGLLAEKSTNINLLANGLSKCAAAGDKAGCKNLEDKIRAEYDQMLEDGSMEEAQRLFQDGLCAAGQACLLSMENVDGPVMTEMTINYLVETQGMDEATAATLVRKASEMDDGGTRAMVLLVASTRGFNQYTKDLDVVDSEVWGGEGSDLKGQKDDLRVTVTCDSFDKWKESLGGGMSSVERDLEHAAKCAGDGVGLESLGKSQVKDVERSTDDEGGCTVTFGVEQKARKSTTKGRTKMGEGNTSRVSKICKDTEGLDDLEQQFLEANDRRMEACAGKNKKSFDGQSAKDAACNFQDKVDESMKGWNTLAAGQPVLDDEGKRVEGAPQQMVRAWFAAKSSNDKTAKERAKLATAGFNAMPNETKEQREAINKIGLELEQAAINKMLDEQTDDSGKVSGEALGYLLQRSSQDGASLDECVKDVRGYSDNTQRTGLINSTVYGSIGMVNSGQATVTRKKGSNSFSITNTEGVKLMGGSFERGQMISVVGVDAMTEQEVRNQEAHSPTTEELMKDFLVGQASLLEKLIAQTT
jgi:hypothetical protein